MKVGQISAGKLRGIVRLADEEGKFRMMAIDQRRSLQHMLGEVLNREVTYQDLVNVKKLIVKVLAPYSSATLIDPFYGYPSAAKYFPRNTGLLLAIEETGYDKAGSAGKERKSRLISGWDVAKVKRVGADGVKLLLYYRGDASPEVIEHQRALARRVGEECVKYDIPYVLELVSYPLDEDELTFAQRKPEIVLSSVREFSKEEYHVDVLKIEFPADLKFTKGYAEGAFDGKKREPIYSLSDVEGFCREITKVAKVPWVILSAGVGIKEFLEEVMISSEAGASGFLCGRALWKDCVNYYPDLDAVEVWLMTSGVENFNRLYRASEGARPYFETEAYRDYQLLGFGEDWHKTYLSFDEVRIGGLE